MKRTISLVAMLGIVVIGTLSVALLSEAQPKAQANPRQMAGQRADVGQSQRERAAAPNQRDRIGFGLNLAGIELSDEQKEQMKQQSRDFQVDTAEIRQQLQFAQQDLRQEMRSETVDQSKVDSLWGEITSLRQELGQAQVNHMLALKGMLTSEQLVILQQNEQQALELQKLRLEQRELLLSDRPDVQRLQQIQAEIAEKEVALERERLEKLAEKYANLTPEQQEKLRQVRHNRQRMQPPSRQ